MHVYHPEGYSAVLKTTALLQRVEVEVLDSGAVKIVTDLSDYQPYHEDLDVEMITEVPINENDNEEFTVEEIVERKYNSKEGRFEYFVKWQGYSNAYNTWELESNIPDLFLKEYELKHSSYGDSMACSARTGLRDPSKRKKTYDSAYYTFQ
uniref:Chromo domain-containing protein n=1 Tax=Amphimedon queenslandica TaxID=400682 RepID=A0A1X7U644_AMPQE